MLLDQTDGYKKGKPTERNLKETHSLFIDDLKVYQENNQKLEIEKRNHRHSMTVKYLCGLENNTVLKHALFNFLQNGKQAWITLKL